MAQAPEDEARAYLAAFFEAEGANVSAVSKQIRKGHAYLNQYIMQKKPKWLREPEREALVKLFPALDEARLKPPPTQVESAAASSRKRSDQARVNAPRKTQLVDDPDTLEMLDIWGRIPPDKRPLAFDVLRLMADQAASDLA